MHGFSPFVFGENPQKFRQQKFVARNTCKSKQNLQFWIWIMTNYRTNMNARFGGFSFYLSHVSPRKIE